jgi:hypothetical protein
MLQDHLTTFSVQVFFYHFLNQCAVMNPLVRSWLLQTFKINQSEIEGLSTKSVNLI